MAAPVKTLDHVNVGVVARDVAADGTRLAVCVGFGRDYRPRVRFYRASAGRWTRPELVDRARLAPLVGVDTSPQQQAVLPKALEALWATPNLGFGSADLAILAAEVAKAPQAPTSGCLHAHARRGKDVPRRWGSWRTQVCLDCGAFRTHAHNEDPGAVTPRAVSAWYPAVEYDEMTAEPEDE